MLRVVEHHLPEQQALEDVRETITAELRDTRAAQLARNAAAAFIADAPVSDDLAALALMHGGVWEDRRLIRRDDASAPQQVVTQVFALGQPQGDAPVWDTVVLPTGGAAVTALYEIEPGAAESIPRDQRDAQQYQLGQQAGMAELAAYADAIREDADVVITPEALNPIYY